MTDIDFVTSKEQGVMRPPVLEASHPKQWRILPKKQMRLPTQHAAVIVTAASHTCYLHCHYWRAVNVC